MKKTVKIRTEVEREVCDRCDVAKADEATGVVIRYWIDGKIVDDEQMAEVRKSLCNECRGLLFRALTKRKRSTTKDSG